MHYFNEFDPGAAAWLRELMADNLIPQGDVDERSITEVQASDLEGYVQCHFFAGIGGWPLALRLAGWPDDEPGIWTGSCPCQPYSAAGKQLGNADERNLWPAFFRLIRECRPDVVFGEQVEGAIRHGWLDGVQADLEGEDYAVGHCVLGAHSAGAPHIRQRLFWVADAGHGIGRRACQQRSGCESPSDREQEANESERCGGTRWLADAKPLRTRPGVAGIEGQAGIGRDGPANGRDDGSDGLEHATGNGREQGRTESSGRSVASGCGPDGMESGVNWSDSRIIICRNGKARRIPTQPALFPLADGIPGRVGLLRGAGNAIVPQVAAAFIQAYREVMLATDHGPLTPRCNMTTATINQRIRKLDGERAKWERSQIREAMLEEAAGLLAQADLEEARGCGAYADHLRRHADRLTREATA